MKINSTQLIDELLVLSEQSIQTVEKLKLQGIQTLNHKKDKDSWSALECIAHLNLYGDFYLPEIQKRILNAPQNTTSYIFKAGLLGNYFANLMQVKNGKITKMKTPKDKNPANSQLTLTVLDRFIKQQQLLISLLNESKKVNLNQVKTSISLSKLIKLKLGDTFRFYVYHVQRHILQAEKAVFLMDN